MHELPRELGNSLRSFRNSVHRHSTQYDVDLEKLENDSGKEFRETSSSLILVRKDSSESLWRDPKVDSGSQHPILSRQALGLSIAAPDEQTHEIKQQAQHTISRHTSRHTNHSHHLETPAAAKRPLITAPKVHDPDPAADRLDDDETPLPEEDFYKLMGMKPPISKSENPKKLGMKNGMYSRIVAKYEYINNKYRIFDVLAYVLLVLQLLLGAVFIVLGSLTSINSHVSIAILGALSTVTAGSLALMKGQGLPNRLHQMRDDLHNVKFEAEELYWDVAAGRPVLYRDIRKLREDYLRVVEDGRRNHPDTWNSAAQQIAAGVRSFPPKGKIGVPAPGAVANKIG